MYYINYPLEIRNNIKMDGILEILGSLLLMMWSMAQENGHIWPPEMEIRHFSRPADTEPDFNMIPSDFQTY